MDDIPWFTHLFDEIIVASRNLSEEDICKLVHDATVINGDFSGEHKITQKVLESAKKVKLIQFHSVSYAGVDLEAANQMGIPVSNNPGWNAVSMAEHVLMAMLMLLKRTLYVNRETHKANWVMLKIIPTVHELRGKTVGILGYGKSGRELSKLLRVFDVKILYNKRNRLSLDLEKELGVEYRSFNNLLEESDILSIHVPLSEETRGLIGKAKISKMKPGSILIHISRGEVVDAFAVAEAIKNGYLSGAGIDVFDPEPIEPDNPLIGLENVLLTSHMAGVTAEALDRCREQCVENVERVLNGEKPLYVVNGVT
jgi:phosphoglycerate dehydrogenase-like enzyme